MSNDSDSNLEIKDGTLHRVQHRYLPDNVKVPCYKCGVKISLTKEQYHGLQQNLLRGKTGPYHSFCKKTNQYT